MSASAIWVHSVARLGSIIRFSDGTPKPPARFKRKLADWNSRNGTGRLAEIGAPYRIGEPGRFTLHMGDFGDDAVIIMQVNKVFTTDCPFTFELISEPTPGTALCLTSFNGRDTLQHLAPTRAEAEAWLSHNRFRDARIDVVPDRKPAAV